MKRLKALFKIFYIFSVIGIQMIGNLATMIPILEMELINKRKMIAKNELLDSIAIGRCGPGAAIINTVAFLGSRIDNFLGAVFAVTGFTFFPFIIIIQISFVLNYFSNNNLIKDFFIGGLGFIIILIIKSMIELAKSTLVDKTTICIFIVTLIILL